MRAYRIAAALSLFAIPFAPACSSSDSNAGSDDQAATAVKRPNPGVVKISFHSTVGVLLDDVPAAAATEIESSLVGHDTEKEEFWKERAKQQMLLVLNRSYYRGGYYAGGLTDDTFNADVDKATFLKPTKGQLPLPPDVDLAGVDLWKPNITF